MVGLQKLNRHHRNARAFAMFCIAFYRGGACGAVAFYRYLRRFAAAGVIFSPISSGFTAEVMKNDRFSSRRAGGNAYSLCFVSRFTGGQHVRQSLFIGIYVVSPRQA